MKVLILDGIGGVPLGREIAQALQNTGLSVVHLDCLKQAPRPYHGIRSAFTKAVNRANDRDSFIYLPKQTPEKLRQLLRQEKPSHILVIGFVYKFYDPAQLQKLAREAGAKLCLYDTDSCNLYSKRREFVFFMEKELPIYDLILSFSSVTTRLFKETRGLNAIHMPFGAMPIKAQPQAQTLDAVFIGSCDLRRIFLLEHIRSRVTVRGSRWHRNLALMSQELASRVDDRPVWGAELHAMLAASKIVINITRTDFYGAETGVNLRIFEALSAGCMLLTDYCPEIENLFQIGEEIDVFRTSEELAEKVEFYLAHPDQRLKVAKAGQEAFLSKHTWKKRVEQQLLPSLQSL